MRFKVVVEELFYHLNRFFFATWLAIFQSFLISVYILELAGFGIVEMVDGIKAIVLNLDIFNLNFFP